EPAWPLEGQALLPSPAKATEVGQWKSRGCSELELKPDFRWPSRLTRHHRAPTPGKSVRRVIHPVGWRSDAGTGHESEDAWRRADDGPFEDRGQRESIPLGRSQRVTGKLTVHQRVRRRIVEMVEPERMTQLMRHDRDEIDAPVVELEAEPFVGAEFQLRLEALERPHVESDRAPLDLGSGRHERKLGKEFFVVEAELDHERCALRTCEANDLRRNE